MWAEDRSRSPHLDSSAPSFACRAQHYSCGVVLGARSGVGRGQSLNAAMPDCLPAVISLIRRMLTTGELARREASRSDPERLVAFSHHNHLACDQSSRFWALPAAYRRDLLAPAAGEHAVLAFLFEGHRLSSLAEGFAGREHVDELRTEQRRHAEPRR